MQIRDFLLNGRVGGERGKGYRVKREWIRESKQ